MKEKLKSELSGERYKHSLGVCEEAVRLAEMYGADREKAYIAGLLHDCAKVSIEKQLELVKEYKLELDEITLLCKPVIHAPLGAEVAKREYGVRDEEILGAIRKHTVAGDDMSLLDKIIYVADLIEPNRDYPGANELRRASDEDIDKVYLMCLERSIIFNTKKHSIIHPDTISAWNRVLK